MISDMKSNIPLDLMNCQYISSVPFSHSSRMLASQSILAQDSTYLKGRDSVGGSHKGA